MTLTRSETADTLALANPPSLRHNSPTLPKGSSMHYCFPGALVLLFLPWLVSDLSSRDDAQPDDAALRKAVTFYASFDDNVKGDFGAGELTLSTRFNHETEKGKFVFQKGYDPKVFRIAAGKGIQGGA